MSNQAGTSLASTFKENMLSLIQQKGSRLRDLVLREEIRGEYGYFDQIGPSNAAERTARHSDSPIVNTPHARRRVTLRDFEWGDLIDNQDKAKSLDTFDSAYVQAAGWAMGRKIDDVIIEAATGTAATGKNGATLVALPSTQKIAVGGAGLTVAKLLQAKEILDAAENDPDEPRFIAVSAKQISNLLNNTQVTSADYNTVKALAQGQLDSFLGFNFIRTQRLNLDQNGDRQCFAWSYSGLLLATAQESVVEVSPRPDKAFSTYVYARMSIGATRMEEQKVVEIACDE